MSKNQKPNIIVFFTDQQRWDTVGCYGNPVNLTPNLDALAAKGIRFENAFTVQPVCGPARSCLMTGKYATTTGCYRNGIPLPQDEKTIANYLKDEGYEVAYIGKWHLASTVTEPVPIEKRGGFTDYWLASDVLEFTSHPYGGKMFDKDNNPVEFTNYRADALTDFALNYLRTRSGKKPFFLFLSYLEPHFQNDMNRFVAPDGYAERYKDAPVPKDLAGKNGDWKENLADYYGMCKNLDENLGRIIEELKTLGIDDNTVLIFTSDHGCHFRTRNGEYKRSCHESSIRIPMVIYGPGFEGGKVIDELVTLIDLTATLLDIGGASIPDDMQGRTMIPLIKGTISDWPQEIFIQISESQVGRALRTKHWKYCVDAPDKNGWTDSCSDVYVEQYLYNLDTDPYEQNNLVSDPAYRDICKQMADILKKRMVAAGEKEPKILSAIEVKY